MRLKRGRNLNADFKFEEPFQIAPSILSADFTRLGEEIETVKAGGAKILHIDVMDGRFVPNITIGLPVLKSIRKATDLILDCHLMIVEPNKYAAEFAEAGADMVSVHIEAEPHLHRALGAIREAGGKAGVAINPGTSLSELDSILEYADFILLMSVNPGFGGQKFIKNAYSRLNTLRDWISERNLNTKIEIDGGIDAKNIASVVEAGAEILVSGSSVFGEEEPAKALENMREIGTAWV